MTVRHRSNGRSDHSRRPVTRVASELRENLGALREEVGERATNLTRNLRERGLSAIDEQKTRAAAEISSIGAAVRRAADKLHDQKSETLAHYIDTAAESIDSVARYVRKSDLNDLTREIEQFARRRPALIVGGMFIAGLAVGRFVKAAQPPLESTHARRNGSRHHSSSRRPRRA
ncbi:MAG: hypothetical protein QOF78_4567 [Phycisphaerales bacterium]|jgi:hypothetical protein|nr:hypothetical protein [Phycisphaerales bacterium]